MAELHVSCDDRFAGDAGSRSRGSWTVEDRGASIAVPPSTGTTVVDLGVAIAMSASARSRPVDRGARTCQRLLGRTEDGA